MCGVESGFVAAVWASVAQFIHSEQADSEGQRGRRSLTALSSSHLLAVSFRPRHRSDPAAASADPSTSQDIYLGCAFHLSVAPVVLRIWRFT